jgi:hypothetical protein
MRLKTQPEHYTYKETRRLIDDIWGKQLNNSQTTEFFMRFDQILIVKSLITHKIMKRIEFPQKVLRYRILPDGEMIYILENQSKDSYELRRLNIWSDKNYFEGFTSLTKNLSQIDSLQICFKEMNQEDLNDNRYLVVLRRNSFTNCLKALNRRKDDLNNLEIIKYQVEQDATDPSDSFGSEDLNKEQLLAKPLNSLVETCSISSILPNIIKSNHDHVDCPAFFFDSTFEHFYYSYRTINNINDWEQDESGNAKFKLVKFKFNEQFELEFVKEIAIQVETDTVCRYETNHLTQISDNQFSLIRTNKKGIYVHSIDFESYKQNLCFAQQFIHKEEVPYLDLLANRIYFFEDRTLFVYDVRNYRRQSIFKFSKKTLLLFTQSCISTRNYFVNVEYDLMSSNFLYCIEKGIKKHDNTVRLHEICLESCVIKKSTEAYTNEGFEHETGHNNSNQLKTVVVNSNVSMFPSSYFGLELDAFHFPIDSLSKMFFKSGQEGHIKRFAEYYYSSLNSEQNLDDLFGPLNPLNLCIYFNLFKLLEFLLKKFQYIHVPDHIYISPLEFAFRKNRTYCVTLITHHIEKHCEDLSFINYREFYLLLQSENESCENILSKLFLENKSLLVPKFWKQSEKYSIREFDSIKDLYQSSERDFSQHVDFTPHKEMKDNSTKQDKVFTQNSINPQSFYMETPLHVDEVESKEVNTFELPFQFDFSVGSRDMIELSYKIGYSKSKSLIESNWHYLHSERFEYFKTLHLIKGFLVWSFTVLFIIYIVLENENDILRVFIVILTVLNLIYELIETIAFSLFKPSL